MTSNNPNFLQQSGISVAQEFHDFVETSVIPATTLQSAEFWDAFASLACQVCTGNTNCTREEEVQADDTTIPVRACSPAVNATWGSLYDALYSDNVIPHTAGLKPGSRINVARRDRVIRCGKDFLDKTFPLSEGSHRDAVSYMAYFQNLLVILADGSTTGLQNPNQFVAKNGPSDSPDSILLKSNGIHTEISFDCNGKVGSSDMAFIDDIQLETAKRTLFDFEAPSATEKCSAYSNWIAIVRSQRNRTISSRCGEQRTIRNGNWAITSSRTDKPCTLVLDQNGNPVPDSVIDAITAAIIETAYSENLSTVSLCLSDSELSISDTFVTQLQHFLCSITARGTDAANSPQTGSRTNAQTNAQTIVKVISTSADNRAKPARPINGTGSDSAYVTSPVTATIDTMQSHGYDVAQTAAL